MWPTSAISFREVVAGDGADLLQSLDRIGAGRSSQFAFRPRAGSDPQPLVHGWAYRVERDHWPLIYCAFLRPDGDLTLASDREGDRRKDEFLAVLAHELRNPLAPIRLWTQRLLGAEGASPVVRHASEVVDRQVRHLTRLVEDLLEVSRFMWGKVALRMELVSLQEAIELAVQMAQPLIEERRHELTVWRPARRPVGARRPGPAGRDLPEPAGERRQIHAPSGDLRLTVRPWTRRRWCR